MDSVPVGAAAPAASVAATDGLLRGLWRRWSPKPLMRLSLLIHAAALPAMLVFHEHWRAPLLIVLGDHALLGIIGMWPRSQWMDHNILRLPAAAAQRGEVCLSFDDGPHPLLTPLVLELLERHGAKASFFCVAVRAAQHPELVREIIRRGHSVENHSYRHSYTFACYGVPRLYRDLKASQTVLRDLAGIAPLFFRAPVGLRSPLLAPVIAWTGLRYVSWTRRGYDAVDGDAARVLRRLRRSLSAGDILLLHDAGGATTAAGTPVVLEVLPRLLQELAARGLRSVSLPSAFGCDCRGEPFAVHHP
jgi:peptidoglycan/xylan/chitin deacetylase (PgdA/CDA1 family)